MLFAVIITFAAPSIIAPLQPQHAQMIADQLGRFAAGAREAAGPHGQVVTVVDRWVGTHPDGAMMAIVVNAADADTALNAVKALAGGALQTIDGLTGWTITNCDIRRFPVTHQSDAPVSRPA